MTDTDWTLRALCRYEGHPSWWDADLDHPEDPRRRELRLNAAAAICDRCPVSAACAATFDPRLDAGMWAGQLHGSHTLSHSIDHRRSRRSA